MPSTVIKLISGLTLSASLTCCLAAEKAPAILLEPVFRTQYDARVVKFEYLPSEAYAKCSLITENLNFNSVWFIFGKVHDRAGRTFYAVSGYEIPRRPSPGNPKFETQGFGWIFQTDGDSCTMIGNVQETFNARAFDETPQIVLQDLARDVVTRYERAYGGKAGLRKMLRQKRVKMDPYAAELNAAFRSHFE